MADAGGTKQTSPSDIVICTVGCIIAIILLYIYVLKPLIHPLFFYWKLLLISPCYFLGKMIPHFSETLRNLFLSFRPEKLKFLDDMFDVFDTSFPSELMTQASQSAAYDFNTMMEMVQVYSSLTLIIFIPLTLFYMSKIGKIRTFQTLYTRETLLKENQKVFSSIVPIVDRDINKEYLNIGPWSMPESPLFFCIIHKLLIVESENLKDGEPVDISRVKFFSMKDIYQGLTDDLTSKELRNANLVPDPLSPYLYKENVFRADIAAGIFLKQLGLKFMNGHFIGALKRKSKNECGNYWRAVFAGMLYRFGAGSSDKKKIAFPILDKFAKAYAGTGPIKAEALSFCTEELVDELWDGFDGNYKFAHSVLPFVTFEYSFMMHLGNFAKKNGKLSPSDFLWLRPVDRTLYFSLDQIGARVGHVETLGPWSHYNGELVNGFGLHIPYLVNAVEGLYLTLASEGWVPYKNISYTQEGLFNALFSKKVSGDGEYVPTESPVKKMRDILNDAEMISDWDRVYSIVRPYPEKISQNVFSFFSEEDKRFVAEHIHDFAEKVPGSSVTLCPIFGQDISDSAVAIPLWDIEIHEDFSAIAKIEKILVCSAAAAKYLQFWEYDTDDRENLKKAFLQRGIKQDDLDDIFSYLSEIAFVYDKIKKVEYDKNSSVYADLVQLSKRKS